MSVPKGLFNQDNVIKNQKKKKSDVPSNINSIVTVFFPSSFFFSVFIFLFNGRMENKIFVSA